MFFLSLDPKINNTSQDTLLYLFAACESSKDWYLKPLGGHFSAMYVLPLPLPVTEVRPDVFSAFPFGHYLSVCERSDLPCCPLRQ